MSRRFESLDALFAAFDRYGGETYGEAVTQRSHMLQCAALAIADGGPDALVAAALLHDIGYLQPKGAAGEAQGPHEDIGAESLSLLFGPAVCAPIALHVAAKRYLCAVRVDYLDQLSPASRESLALQGGPFTADKAAVFMAQPYAEAAVRLRLYDDEAKDPIAAPPALTTYRPRLEALLLTPDGAVN